MGLKKFIYLVICIVIFLGDESNFITRGRYKRKKIIEGFYFGFFFNYSGREKIKLF